MREVKIEIEVLDMLYQNLLMIKETILRVVKIQDTDKNLNENLKNILLMYKKLIQAVMGMLKTRKKEVKNLSVGEKMVTYMSVRVNLNRCDNIKDIVNMIIQDINIRNEEMKKVIDDYSKISKTIINLYNRIIIANEKCIEILKNT